MNTPRSTPFDERPVRLLRRHWQWLEAQPRGIQSSLRLLVEVASRDLDGQYQAIRTRETCYLYMRDMAGDRPHFEDAVRALFANDMDELQRRMTPWPSAIREHVTGLLASIEAGNAKRATL